MRGRHSDGAGGDRGWRIIPVNPRGTELLGETAYRTLAEVPEPVGLVDVFRPSAQTLEVARLAAA